MYKLYFLLLFIPTSCFSQSFDYINKPSSNFRIYYDQEQNVVDGQDSNYTFFADIQTDKNGDIIGFVDFKHISGIVFSQERWLKISPSHHKKNVMNEIKIYDPQTGLLSNHMIIKNPEKLPYNEISKNLNGFLYKYENEKLISVRTLYNGEKISEVFYNDNGITKYESLKTFENIVYPEMILFDYNGLSYRIINDNMKEKSWINWTKGFNDIDYSYSNNSFYLTGTKDNGASVFRELPFDSKKDHSVNLTLKRISGNDFSGVLFGAQAGGVRNFWNFSISSNGFYQILQCFNGVILPIKLNQGRIDDLPAEYRNNEVYEIIKNNIPIGYSKYIKTGVGSSNILDVKKIGDNLTFSINGIVVENIVNANMYGTGTGFIIVQNSPGSDETNTVAFSDFSLTEFAPDVPEWLKLNPSSSSKMTATGTGFAISQNGMICTNYHVIQGAKKINIFVNGKKIPANVLVTDEQSDLAILKLTKDNIILKPIPYKFNNYFPNIGENVFVLGFPSSNILGQSIKLTNGIVSSTKGYNDEELTYQISAPIQPGNSGSPLFADNGNLIGIINSGVPSLENVGYAIKMQNLLNLMKKVPTTPVLQSKILSSESLTNKAKKVAEFIYLIEIEL